MKLSAHTSKLCFELPYLDLSMNEDSSNIFKRKSGEIGVVQL